MTSPEDRCAAQTGMAPNALAARFESLGDNCEFGFVQRHFGAEPIQIFRFSNPKAHKILHGLRNGFADLGENVSIALDNQKPRREWIVADLGYGSRQHTHIFEGDPREDNIQTQMRTYLAYLKRGLLDDVASGEKIFVIKSVPDVTDAMARDLARALRALGPAWLLWAVDGPGEGRAEIVEDGLLRAEVKGILPERHPNWLQFPWTAWLDAMIAAWRLTRPKP